MLHTERLLVRPLRAADWPSMQRIAADFQESPYAVYDMPLPTEEPRIRELTEELAATQAFFAVLLDGVMIGYVCFHEENGCYDLGFCFHSGYHGNGYAHESCAALMAYMTRERAVKTFTAGTALRNVPARRLLEKLGFVLISTEALSFHKDAAGRDIVFEGGCYRWG